MQINDIFSQYCSIFLIQSLNKKIKTYGSRLNSTSTTQNEFEKPKKPANFILKINPNLIVK